MNGIGNVETVLWHGCTRDVEEKVETALWSWRGSTRDEEDNEKGIPTTVIIAVAPTGKKTTTTTYCMLYD
jgi:hypothetical protein